MGYSNIKIAIYGAGPSAAYINAACQSRGISPDVYTVKQVGSPGGAFWLRLSPRLALMTEPIHLLSVGRSQIYMSKQWGEEYADRPCSFPTETKVAYGYNPKDVWDSLWEGANIILTAPITDRIATKKASNYDIVFMTFPTEKSRMEMSKHLVSTPIAFFDTPWLTTNTVIYNGDKGNMVRLSMLFGKTYVEYANSYVPDAELYNDGKLVFFNDLHPDTPEWDPGDVPADNIVLLGRYAEWSRKVLSHEAYARAIETIDIYRKFGAVSKYARRNISETSRV